MRLLAPPITLPRAQPPVPPVTLPQPPTSPVTPVTTVAAATYAVAAATSAAAINGVERDWPYRSLPEHLRPIVFSA